MKKPAKYAPIESWEEWNARQVFPMKEGDTISWEEHILREQNALHTFETFLETEHIPTRFERVLKF